MISSVDDLLFERPKIDKKWLKTIERLQIQKTNQQTSQPTNTQINTLTNKQTPPKNKHPNKQNKTMHNIAGVGTAKICSCL